MIFGVWKRGHALGKCVRNQYCEAPFGPIGYCDELKGRESFSESCVLKNPDFFVRKRLPTLCKRQYGTVQLFVCRHLHIVNDEFRVGGVSE